MRTSSLVKALLLCCAAVLAPAHAQSDYPNKPIRLVVPFPAGAGTDILARALGQKMSEDWGQQVIVDNRPGGSTIIGSENVAKSPADGYTLLMASNNHALNPALFPKLPYDSVRDFAAVSEVAILPLVLVVHPGVPAKNVRELIALAKASPGKLNFASTGNGSPPHLAGETFRLLAKIDIVHVPYKGSAPALTDLVGGQVTMMFSNTLSAMPHVRDNRLRALAVSTAQRIPAAPELPTMAEAGVPGFDVSVWAGLLAPAGTPRPVIDKISTEVAHVLSLADVKERLGAQGAVLVPSKPDAFSAFVNVEIERWGKLVRATNMKVD